MNTVVSALVGRLSLHGPETKSPEALAHAILTRARSFNRDDPADRFCLTRNAKLSLMQVSAHEDFVQTAGVFEDILFPEGQSEAKALWVCPVLTQSFRALASHGISTSNAVSRVCSLFAGHSFALPCGGESRTPDAVLRTWALRACEDLHEDSDPSQAFLSFLASFQALAGLSSCFESLYSAFVNEAIAHGYTDPHRLGYALLRAQDVLDLSTCTLGLELNEEPPAGVPLALALAVIARGLGFSARHTTLSRAQTVLFADFLNNHALAMANGGPRAFERFHTLDAAPYSAQAVLTAAACCAGALEKGGWHNALSVAAELHDGAADPDLHSDALDIFLASDEHPEWVVREILSAGIWPAVEPALLTGHLAANHEAGNVLAHLCTERLRRKFPRAEPITVSGRLSEISKR